MSQFSGYALKFRARQLRTTGPIFFSGSVELLKYLALGSMLVDHVNKALFASSLAWAVPVGRLAMPIFSVLMAYNLARPGADPVKAVHRLLVFGLLATPFHFAINGGGWLPFNVLFTFAVAAGVIAAVQAGRFEIALAAFAVGGALVDYLWTGPALVIAAYAFFKRPSWNAAMGVLAMLAAMCAVVGNAWAFLALVPLAIATLYAPSVSRLRWFFWAFYPTHLAALWLLTRV